MPRDVAPAATAFSAYSIWTSFPLGLKVVREKEYCRGNTDQLKQATAGSDRQMSAMLSGRLMSSLPGTLPYSMPLAGYASPGEC